MDRLSREILERAYVTDLWADIRNEIDKGDNANFSSIETNMEFVEDMVAVIYAHEKELLTAIDLLALTSETALLDDVRDALLRKIGDKGKLTWKLVTGSPTSVNFSIDWSLTPEGNPIAEKDQMPVEEKAKIIVWTKFASGTGSAGDGYY